MIHLNCKPINFPRVKKILFVQYLNLIELTCITRLVEIILNNYRVSI